MDFVPSSGRARTTVDSIGAMMRRRLAVSAALGVAGLAVARVRAADVVSTFRNGTNNWSNPNAWTPYGVPNNGASTYDVDFSGQYGIFGGDMLKFNQNATIQKLTMTGGYLSGPDSGGPYTLTLNDTLNWSGGIIAGLNIAANAGGTINLNSYNNELGATLQNKGTLTYTSPLPVIPNSAYPLRLDPGAIIDNQAGATFNLVDDAGIGVSGAGAVIQNEGLFEKTGGTGTSQIGTGFNNAGSILVQTGTLEFLGGAATQSGSLTASAGATLAFDDGATTFTSTSSIGGQGTIQFAGNPLTFSGKLLGGAGPLLLAGGETQFNAGSNLSSLALPAASGGRAVQVSGSGTTTFNTGSTVSLANLSTSPFGASNTTLVLTGPDDIALTGPANWMGGMVSGPLTSPNNNLFVNAPMTIAGNGIALDHRNLVNNSTITWTGGFVQAIDGAVINNPAGSTFNIQNIQTDNAVEWGSHLANTALPSFNNAGLIVKSAGSGETDFLDVRLTNTGTVRVDSGTLAFYHTGGPGSGNPTGYADSGVNSGTYQISQGARMIVSDHTMTASSTVQGAGTMQFEGNYNPVSGTYNITGTTIIYGGVAFQPGANVVSVGQLLNDSGGVTFNTGKPIVLHDLILNGILNGSDPITVTGKFSGSGTLAASVVAPGVVSPGNSPGILAVQGSLTMEPSSTLNIELAGNKNTSEQTLYDVVNSSGDLTISGDLVLNLIDGYVPAPTDDLAIVTSTGQLTGLFDNVAPGQRLMTADGTGSFLVNYGAGSSFGTDDVTLSNFQAVPEPGAFALLALAGATGLARRRRHGTKRGSHRG